MNNKNIFKIGIPVLLLIAVGAFIWSAAAPGKYDEFAQCLGNAGAKFYGAFWCPHCQEQKKLFGNSVDKLPYEECSTPDGKGQLAICKEKGIQSYPTWIFADDSRETGVLSLAKLAEKTSCALPE